MSDPIGRPKRVLVVSRPELLVVLSIPIHWGGGSLRSVTWKRGARSRILVEAHIIGVVRLYGGYLVRVCGIEAHGLRKLRRGEIEIFDVHHWKGWVIVEGRSIEGAVSSYLTGRKVYHGCKNSAAS